MGGLLHGVWQVAGGRQMPEVTAVLWSGDLGVEGGAHERVAHKLGRVQEWSAFPPGRGDGKAGDMRTRGHRCIIVRTLSGRTLALG